MKIPFLSLKYITEKYSAEIHEAVNRVVDERGSGKGTLIG